MLSLWQAEEEKRYDMSVCSISNGVDDPPRCSSTPCPSSPRRCLAAPKTFWLWPHRWGEKSGDSERSDEITLFLAEQAVTDPVRCTSTRCFLRLRSPNMGFFGRQVRDLFTSGDLAGGLLALLEQPCMVAETVSFARRHTDHVGRSDRRTRRRGRKGRTRVGIERWMSPDPEDLKSAGRTASRTIHWMPEMKQGRCRTGLLHPSADGEC